MSQACENSDARPLSHLRVLIGRRLAMRASSMHADYPAVRALSTLRPHKRWLVYPGAGTWRLAEDVQVIPLAEPTEQLRTQRAQA